MYVNYKDTQAIKDETVREVCGAVKSTMGPDGNIVVCDKSGKPHPTKDGVTVAKAMRFDDPTKDLISTMIAECCLRTDRICGDGTTTTAFLLNEFYLRFKSQISFRTKKLLRQYTDEVLDVLKAMSTEVDINSTLLSDVLLTTSNNDQVIVNKILEVYRDNPHLPDLEFRDSGDDQDQVQYRNGCTWPGGFLSPDMSELGTGLTEQFHGRGDYRPILVSDKIRGLDSKEEIMKFVDLTEEYVKSGGTYLIVCRGADEVTEAAIKQMNTTVGRKAFKVIKINAAGSSGVSLVNDIALVLGTEMMTELMSNPNVYADEQEFPMVHVNVTQFAVTGRGVQHTVNLQRAADAVKKQIDELDVEQRNSALGKIIKARLNILSGGSVTIYVGGVTESDIKERRDRFEDVGRVCRSALSNGVLQGCGYSLAQVGQVLETKYPECDIAATYASVLRQQVVYLMKTDFDNITSYTNLATGEVGPTPGAINVWDAALATCTALEAAVSMAITLMDTDSIIMNSRLADVRI
ncbi:heat shock protein 60 family chaperone GroEL [Vibrio phage pTD1]|uniref:Heat shock protein 60 family chaperone GroEL n=1 Tax=Vibrio phage pTD1 TaxID=1938577 RepID=A0A1Q2U2P4_9CAUD|nr:chaperonin groEL [Vibrio phage pTD1]BAW98236.1 heat shock protein 60 family chaperone GroEL [Vibrio phage pTD1]